MFTSINRTHRLRQHGGVKAIIFVVILLIGAVVSIIWGTRRTGPPADQHLQSDFQRYLGAKLAEATLRSLGTDGGPVVVFSAADPRGPYADLLAALKRKLKEQKVEADVLTPGDLGLGDDDPYADGYERILRKYKPAVIVALALGLMDTSVPADLQSFVDGAGRLVLLGEITRLESHFTDWIRQGKAAAIVRHTGPLRHLAPATQASDAEATPQRHFEQHYTLLTAENINRLIPRKAE